MQRKVFGLIVVGVLVAGCAGSDTNEDSYDYIGWVCGGARQSDDWSCEMREIKDGRAVATSKVAAAVADATAAGGRDVSPSSKQDRQSNLQVVSPPNQNWRSQLPGLDSTPVIPELESSTLAERKLKNRPPRISEPVPSVVAKKASPPPTPDPPAPLPQSSVAKPVVYALGDSVGGDLSVDANKTAYTLQLAAFSDPAQIELFVDRHRLGDLGVRQFQSYSKKQHWRLLVWGAFESPAKAREAWRAIARQYPGVEPWVRSMSSLDMESGQSVAVDG